MNGIKNDKLQFLNLMNELNNRIMQKSENLKDDNICIIVGMQAQTIALLIEIYKELIEASNEENWTRTTNRENIINDLNNLIGE